MAETKKNISIIYYQKNDSPKYIEINKKKFILFLVGLPTLTLIALMLGTLGLIQTSPFHLLDNYRQNAKARVAVASTEQLEKNILNLTSTNKQLETKIEELQKNLADNTNTPPGKEAQNCPEIPVKKQPNTAVANNTQGLSTLSLFKPVAGQKDKTHPASLNLTGFKVASTRENVNVQFNIINLLGADVKLAGYIIVIMKNELTMSVYPAKALNSNDSQINYLYGESFATQRFRPVDASFVHPKKAGTYKFSVYIFAKSGDLIHFENMNLPVN